jgi:riboflavin synthase
MFNGIIEEMGVVDRINRRRNLSILKVRAQKILKGTKAGDSIAVNGVCLTVTDVAAHTLTFDLMKETLVRTSLGGLKPAARVNLERALRVGGRISGHFVTGHIDGVAVIQDRIDKTNDTDLRVSLAKELARYIVPKGSVCLDGVSLTVGEVKAAFFSVYLIPFTKEVTTLGFAKNGDKVNIETDILAKYISGSELCPDVSS